MTHMKLAWGNNSVKASNFNEVYFDIHRRLYDEGQDAEARQGASTTTSTKEFLNFKTEVMNPIERCVGGYGRNINVFFLLAEALWIFEGRKDVAFLDIFNSQLKKYSDDGSVYHAAYGYRLRHFGVHSSNTDETIIGDDQILSGLKELGDNPNSRQVVLQIWNSKFDLGTNTKDKPCNDLLMFKVRQGKLYQTIANRSNDLNLGLTTNVFQFSFIGEIMAKILAVKMGDQVHNSQSLHIYLNDQTEQLQKNIIDKSPENNYDRVWNIYDTHHAIKMDFKFDSEKVEDRLNQVDFFLKSIITMLNKMYISNLTTSDIEFMEEDLKRFSKYFYYVYQLLSVYVEYKKKQINKLSAVKTLIAISEDEALSNSDYFLLCVNFFVARMNEEETAQYKEMTKELQLPNTIGLF